MSKFIATIILGLIATIVATYFQNRSWRFRNLEELGQREFRDAMSVVEHLSNAIDRRLVAQRRFLTHVQRDETNEGNHREYGAALDEWMGSFSSFKSKLFLYFGEDEARTFENEVHALLRETSNVILRTYRLGEDELSSRDLDEYKNVLLRMGLAQSVAANFLNRLNDNIINNKFGTVQYINDINTGDLDKISRTYLFLRLFGIKS